MVCISTVYCLQCLYILIWNFGEEIHGQGLYEENVLSEFRFSEAFFLLLGDELFYIIKIPSNITDPDFAPHTILHAQVTIS
jgi:hypothetical protein